VDDDWPVNTLTYSLEGAPAWASINPGTGALQWTPTEDQGPSQQTMTVVATDNSEPPARVTATFQVTVNEVNTAPRLAEIADRTVTLGESVSFTATATDEDRPANMLTFSLVSPPAGASIDPLEGLFNWSPDASQVGAHSITVQVADNGLPEMRQSETFQVTVVRTLEVTWEVSGGELVLRIRTLSGRTYRVEYQDNGIIGTWQVLVDNVAGNGALKSVSEPITTLVKERFYRAVELP
ncbi:MAG TPA: putative Ig domain-containing protein, partial [Verrucomicrobiota bacterium]|nr:putative Ig domain-containing protein [Verrucomicrobiota bacterium]